MAFEDLSGAVLPPIFFIFLPFLISKLKGNRLSQTISELRLSPLPSINVVLRDALWLTVALLLATVAVHQVFSLIQLHDAEKVAGIVRAEPPASQALGVVLSPPAEEIFFRGYLQAGIGLWPSSIVFAVLHSFYGSLEEVAGALAFALVLGSYFKRSKSLWPCMIAHVAFNALSMLKILA